MDRRTSLNPQSNRWSGIWRARVVTSDFLCLLRQSELQLRRRELFIFPGFSFLRDYERTKGVTCHGQTRVHPRQEVDPFSHTPRKASRLLIEVLSVQLPVRQPTYFATLIPVTSHLSQAIPPSCTGTITNNSGPFTTPAGVTATATATSAAPKSSHSGVTVYNDTTRTPVTATVTQLGYATNAAERRSRSKGGKGAMALGVGVVGALMMEL